MMGLGGLQFKGVTRFKVGVWGSGFRVKGFSLGFIGFTVHVELLS